MRSICPCMAGRKSLSHHRIGGRLCGKYRGLHLRWDCSVLWRRGVQLALLGTKGKWYDHTVSIRNAQPKTEEAAEIPADGEYSVNVTLEGGSGRATVESPAALTVVDGKMTAVILWSSPNYDYMIVDGEKYLPTNTEGNSTFEIPVSALGTPLAVTADTVAMSTPHEIEYTLTFALNG